jgi:sugar lactone lactonase YvrE
MIRIRLLLPLAATLVVTGGCRTGVMRMGENDLPLQAVVMVKGLDAPECAIVDPASGFVYVSNIEAPPEAYWSDNGKGFISRLKPDGTLDTLRWVDSSPAFVLNSPKGMCILNGMLYVTDNTRIVEISIQEAKPLRVIGVPGALRLNDMATDGRDVFVSDTDRGIVQRVDLGPEERHETVAEIESVNGITFAGGTMFAVSWGLHEVFEVDYRRGGRPEPFGWADYFTNLDGIEVLADGAFIVSDFMGSKVCRISADRQHVVTLAELESPADIGMDTKQRLLFVPQLRANQLSVYRLQ